MMKITPYTNIARQPKTLRLLLFACVLLLALVGCELPPRDVEAPIDSFLATDYESTADSTQEYIMVTTALNLPLYVRHEQAAFKAWARARGVKATILGPSEWDIPGQIATIEQVIPLRPAGLLINGTDPGIAQAINKAVAAGIPTVVYDSEIPGSRRHCFIGSDWYQMGYAQGNRMAKLIGGEGKVAVMGILGMSNMEAGFRGFQDAIASFSGIEYLGSFDDKANVEDAARITADLLASYPDLAGLAGFDSNSGPGMALAVKEAGKVGQVRITTVDAEPEHIALVRSGVINLLVGQKRELFSWYGAQFLYDMTNGTNRFSRNDPVAGISPIPQKVNTGLILIDSTNIDKF